MAFSKLQYLKALHGEKMGGAAFRVMVTMFNYTNANGLDAYPGNDRLAADCCTSVSTVKRALNELTEAGWLVKVERGGRSGDGAHWAAKYALGRRWAGESQQVTREPSMGQNGWVNGSYDDMSLGQIDDVNGSDSWDQGFTNDPLSDH